MSNTIVRSNKVWTGDGALAQSESQERENGNRHIVLHNLRQLLGFSVKRNSEIMWGGQQRME